MCLKGWSEQILDKNYEGWAMNNCTPFWPVFSHISRRTVRMKLYDSLLSVNTKQIDACSSSLVIAPAGFAKILVPF